MSGCAVVSIPLLPGARSLEENVLEGDGRDKILLIDISGFISMKEKTGLLGEKKPSMPARVKEVLKKAETDDDIVGIMLKINTPGGSVSASDIIYHEIKEFKKRTGIPVYSSIMNLGTSGGYYICAVSNRIYAHPTAITGSIGVIATKLNVRGLMNKIGVQDEVIKSGEKKDIFSLFRPDTPEEMEILQKIIDELHTRFIDVVSENRSGTLKRAEIEALSDGRPYTARQALDAKLIDEIGYLPDALEGLKKSLDISKARIVEYTREKAYRDTIYSSVPQGGGIGTLNLINIEADSLAAFPGVEFMYVWDVTNR
jgi:protease-4